MTLLRAPGRSLLALATLLHLAGCSTPRDPSGSRATAAPATPAAAPAPAASSALPLPAPVQVPTELAALQHAFALHYFEPRSHFRLARYYRDQGELMLAYTVSESAFERFINFGLADRKQLESAFAEVMNGQPPFDNSPAAEAALRARLEKAPRDSELLLKLADVHISRNQYAEATPLLQRAIAAKPADFTPFAVLARVQSESGQEAQAQQLMTRWAKEHPKSLEAARIEAGLAPKEQQRRLLEAVVKRFPEDGEVLFDLAARVQEEDGAEKGEPLVVRAAALAPKAPHVQGWVGRFFLKARQQPQKALPYYLHAYLLQPGFYDTESVHSRIGRYGSQLAQEAFAKQGEDVAWALAQRDPLLVFNGLSAVSRAWDARHVPALMALMAHDDERVSAAAMQLLRTHVDRASFDAPLRALLQDASPRRRGLATYMAVKLWGAEAYPTLQTLFARDEELLRYDAISALLEAGDPEATRLATAQLEKEPGAGFKAMLESVRSQDAH